MRVKNINTKIPYKWKRQCRKCGRVYGTDFKADSGYCPICEKELSLGRGNRT
jgi:rRNA maturation endonuclease Nob1